MWVNLEKVERKYIKKEKISTKFWNIVVIKAAQEDNIPSWGLTTANR